MNERLTFVGQLGTYQATEAHPLAYGRVSVFYKVTANPPSKVDGPLCVKLFHNDPEGSAEGFSKELAVLQRLGHPNILQLIDFGLQSSGSGGPFLLLPYCSDGNLRRLLEGKRFVPITTAQPILEQVATGLDYAHQSGVIHGDVKPENILLRADLGTRAYLADFGVAKYFAFEEKVSTLRGNEEGGTLMYLSPEQLDDKSYSIRSDIYSFGLVAYELLCGGLPFDRNESLYRQVRAKVTGTLIDPLTLNPSLTESAAAALRLALSVDPSQRPASASELCRLLVQPVAAPSRRISSQINAKLVESDDSGKKEPISKARVAIITAVIAAVGGLLTTVVQNLPQILDKLRGK